LLVDERRHRILQTIEEKGFASLQELADRLGASESTVRRDLEYLDGFGQIRRTRGGATYCGESITPFDDRQGLASREKQAIAQAAAAMIEPDETVLLDGGTTTYEVARRLVGKSLQVVTNSLPIVNLLANQPGIELVVIGGYLYPKTGVALGPVAVAGLKQINARRLVMSTGGITEKGLFNSNALLVEAEREMMAAADEVLVVAASGKFGHSELAHLGPLDHVDRLVTDSGLSDPWRETCRQAGIELTIVDV
jgi:DeoR/GlpR family transcriptional regulator of sugar metabolism